MSDLSKRMPISSLEHSEFLDGLSVSDAFGLLQIIHLGLSCSTGSKSVWRIPCLQ
jgi:hypothetical protein